MAIGAARLFNINLTQNFNRPYFATSIADFWRRWHISLSRWILDYIFKPLQMKWRDGNDCGTAAALIITFLLAGIWHGSNWTFVIFGLLHGLYLTCSVFYRPYQKKLHKILGEKTWVLKIWQIIVTFNLVCFTFIFFRASSLSDALYIIKNITCSISFNPSIISAIFNKFSIIFYNLIHFHFSVLKYQMQCHISTGMNDVDLYIALGYIAFLIFIHSIKWQGHILDILANRPTWLRWGLYYVIILTMVFFGVYGKNQFIYFQF